MENRKIELMPSFFPWEIILSGATVRNNFYVYVIHHTVHTHNELYTHHIHITQDNAIHTKNLRQEGGRLSYLCLRFLHFVRAYMCKTHKVEVT